MTYHDFVCVGRFIIIFIVIVADICKNRQVKEKLKFRKIQMYITSQLHKQIVI